MKKGISILLCGLAVIILTVVLYLTIVGTGVWGAIHFVSLFAVILAEIVTTIYAWFAKGSPRRVAVTFFSAIMIPFAVLLSVVYVANIPYGYGMYLGWYFASTIIVNTICLFLIWFDFRKKREGDSLQMAKRNMLVLRNLVKSILASPAVQSYQKDLVVLEEKLHFSNDCVICTEDEQLRQLLLQLQEKIQNGDSDCQELLAKITLLVDQRNIMSSKNL